MSSERIIQINNQGIAFLQMGNASEACKVLTKASILMSNTRTASDTPISFSWIDLSPETLKLSNESCYLFLRSIRITSDNDDCSPSSMRWAVLYNLAISCHLMACELGQAGNANMRRAHELYEIIRGRFLPGVPMEHRTMVAVALFNNAGCIYREFGMHEQAKACLVKVREIMACLPVERQGLDRKLLFGINLALLRAPTIAGAA